MRLREVGQVGVEERDDLTACPAQPLGERPAFAAVGAACHQDDPLAEGLKDGATLIGRAVIDADDLLDRPACREGFDDPGHRRLLVEERHDRGNRRHGSLQHGRLRCAGAPRAITIVRPWGHAGHEVP